MYEVRIKSIDGRVFLHRHHYLKDARKDARWTLNHMTTVVGILILKDGRAFEEATHRYSYLTKRWRVIFREPDYDQRMGVLT